MKQAIGVGLGVVMFFGVWGPAAAQFGGFFADSLSSLAHRDIPDPRIEELERDEFSHVLGTPLEFPVRTQAEVVQGGTLARAEANVFSTGLGMDVSWLTEARTVVPGSPLDLPSVSDSRAQARSTVRYLTRLNVTPPSDLDDDTDAEVAARLTVNIEGRIGDQSERLGNGEGFGNTAVGIIFTSNSFTDTSLRPATTDFEVTIGKLSIFQDSFLVEPNADGFLRYSDTFDMALDVGETNRFGFNLFAQSRAFDGGIAAGDFLGTMSLGLDVLDERFGVTSEDGFISVAGSQTPRADVAEPATLFLLGAAAVAGLGVRRRTRRGVSRAEVHCELV